MPNFWPINDYYTDDVDQTSVGAAPTTPPGFGPNSRTVMQIRVTATHNTGFDFTSNAKPGFVRSSPISGFLRPINDGPGDGASLVALKAALPLVFAASQPAPIVPQTFYNLAYPATPAANDNFVEGYQTTLNLNTSVSGVPLARIRTMAAGNNYTVGTVPTAPTVMIVGGFPSTCCFAVGPGCPAITCTKAVAQAGLNPIGAVTLLTTGAGYTTPPAVTLGAPAAAGAGAAAIAVQATALATISGGAVNAINIDEPGANYTNTVRAPTCTIAPPTGCVINKTTCVRATCSVMIPTLNTVGSIVLTGTGNTPGNGYTREPEVFLVPAVGSTGQGATAVAELTGALAMTGKNLTEGFDVEYGRMDIRLGSTPNPLTPSVGSGFVLGLARYIDPPTEIMQNGQPIIWRLSHLGVDSHAMHFHLFNLQVVNRVDWTNVLKPPYPDEIGWKETIRTNPMEDLIVAIQPYAQVLPFAVPHSSRVLDPTTPLGSTTNFYPVAPPAGIAAVAQQSNVLTDFGWEYVWHCHLLGHEENDMMRPMVLVVPPPPPPTGLTATVNSATSVTLNWVTTATTATGYTIQRSTTSTFPAGATTVSFNVLGNATNTYTDTTAAANTSYYYEVLAYNGSGNSAWSNVVNASTILPAPTALTAIVNSATSVTLNWTTTATFATGYTIQRATNTAFTAGLTLFDAPGTATHTYTDTTTVANTRYYYRVQAYITAPAVTTAWSNVLTVITAVPPTAFAAVVTRPTPTSATDSAVLTWTSPGGTFTNYTVQRARNATFTSGLVSFTVANTLSTLTLNGLPRGAGVNYWFRIRTNITGGSSAWSTIGSFAAP
jgi:hypothetical protein